MSFTTLSFALFSPATFCLYWALGARRILWPAGSAIGPSLYLGSHFDERGDFVVHRDLPRDPDRELVGLSSETPPAKLDRVAAFAEAVAAAGGTLVVVHPPVPRRRYEEHRANLDAWDAALRDRLSVPVLTTPREAALPEEFFFDTPYHFPATAWSGAPTT